MPTLTQLMAIISNAEIDITALATLAIFFPFFVFFTQRARGGFRFKLRPIRTYDEMKQLASQAAESGQALMVSMGTGQLGSQSTPEVLMGLAVLRHVCRSAAQYDQAVWGTVGDPTMLGAAQTILQRAQSRVGYPEHYKGRQITFYGPEPLAYASGAADEVSRRQLLANLVVGKLGAEGLWLTEEAAARGTRQLGGTGDPAAAALLYATLEDPAIGEDFYAAGGYLRRVSHLGSLATQDLMRVLILLSILSGVILASLGYWV